jgi:hypothetical protein
MLGPGWLELPIFDFRLPIADGHWKELPHHFFNRQSAIVNRQLKPGVWLRPRRAVKAVAHIFAVSPFSTLDSRRWTASGGRSLWLVSPFLPEALGSNGSAKVPTQFVGQIV